MTRETWETTYGDGSTGTAYIEYGIGEGYWVDMGCCLWNRLYKSYPWAKKYLEKDGFKLVKNESIDC